jgi:hypothetical protein
VGCSEARGFFTRRGAESWGAQAGRGRGCDAPRRAAQPQLGSGAHAPARGSGRTAAAAAAARAQAAALARRRRVRRRTPRQTPRTAQPAQAAAAPTSRRRWRQQAGTPRRRPAALRRSATGLLEKQRRGSPFVASAAPLAPRPHRRAGAQPRRRRARRRADASPRAAQQHGVAHTLAGREEGCCWLRRTERHKADPLAPLPFPEFLLATRMTWQRHTREATFLARREPHAQQQSEQVNEGRERDEKRRKNTSRDVKSRILACKHTSSCGSTQPLPFSGRSAQQSRSRTSASRRRRARVRG